MSEPRTVLNAPVVEKGWWAAHVPADLPATEIPAWVEELRPDHPSLPLLRRSASRAEAMQGKPEPADLLCPRCSDTGWIERDTTGRGTVRKCYGPHSNGCPAIAKKVQDAKRRHRAASGEADGL